MDTTAGSWLRWVRAAVLAFVAMSTGTVAHVTADGRLPSVPMLVLILAGCVVAAALLLGRPATTTRIVALTAGGQAGIHALLTMTAGHAGDPVARSTVHPPPPRSLVDPNASGSLFEQYNAARPQVDADLAVPAGVVHLVQDLTGDHAPMMLVHLLAAAVVGLWLASGEHALWTLVALAAAVAVPSLRALLGTPVHAPVLPATSTAYGDRPPYLLFLTRSLPRRGPPVLAV